MSRGIDIVEKKEPEKDYVCLTQNHPMSIEAKKIEIIEAVLQMQDEGVLTSLINNIYSFNE